MHALEALIAHALVVLATAAGAHGTEAHGTTSAPGAREQKDWGIAGDSRAARRTVAIRMTDDMRFLPDRVDVRRGETLRFVLRNDGRLLHEFVLGTRKELDEHAALMLKHPGMEHDEPWMVHVGPGRTGEIVWTFNRAGNFEFACLIAGHYQAGMRGRVDVVEAGKGAR
jgi:uncharacterized cupredoxin-like copper-binding protein